MKIGLITHHWVPNFGANLQALATFQFVKSQGFDIEIINYQPSDFLSFMNDNIEPKQFELHQEFISQHLNLSPKYASSSDLIQKVQPETYQVIISGSDALLRLNETKTREDLNFPNPFWLDWTFNKKFNIKSRGYISVSNMGADYTRLSSDTKKGISNLLAKLNHINVRDSWTYRSLLKLRPGIQINQTIDPVFLLNDYFEIPSQYENNINEPYILLSLYKKTVSANWIKRFVSKANKLGYKVYALPNPEGHTINSGLVDKCLDFPMHPLTWYSLIKRSQGYVGVRFHPVVIALANHVPFVSLDTYQKSVFNPGRSKTYDICKKLNSEKYCLGKIKRKIFRPEKIIKLLVEQTTQTTIDYKKQLEQEKSNLKQALLSIIEQND